MESTSGHSKNAVSAQAVSLCQVHRWWNSLARWELSVPSVSLQPAEFHIKRPAGAAVAWFRGIFLFLRLLLFDDFVKVVVQVRARLNPQAQLEICHRIPPKPPSLD